jgi:hypothetical protein
MVQSTVYIESTVISYYAASRTRDLIMAAHQEITWEWWEGVLPGLDPYVSQIVFDEISRGDTDAAQRRLAAVYHGMDYLVSWNCTHISSGRVRNVVARINVARWCNLSSLSRA